jgi:predicted TIM-barrel fold metal-dependent hydrolase
MQAWAKRLMFGSDQMVWPDTVIDDEVEAINSATFLTQEQKRDIFYENAARFLRLSEAQIAAHHRR